MNPEQVREVMIEHDAPDAYVMDEYSKAFIGITHNNQAVYDFDKIISILKEDMSEEEAIEYIYYNIIGSIPDFNNKYPIILFKEE